MALMIEIQEVNETPITIIPKYLNGRPVELKNIKDLTKGVSDPRETYQMGIESVEDLIEYLRENNRFDENYDYEAFVDDQMADEHGLTPLQKWIFEELANPGLPIPEKYLKLNIQLKNIVIHKEGGSILDLLKEQLPELEIFDLLNHFGLDDLLSGGLKDTGSVLIQITIDGSNDEDTKKVPDIKDIELGDNSYRVEVVTDQQDMLKGLSNRESLPKDEGMLFDFGYVLPEVSFWMKDTTIPLDIIFINDDDEVIKVYKGEPEDETLVTVKNVRYVVELNQNSGIKKGDELDMDPEDKGPVMKVLAPDGSTQMELQGGERIFSRKNTKTLIRMAKRANKSKSDSDYRKLGKRMFKYIHTLNTNKPEYVEVPEN